LEDAARRVRQIQAVTHALKPIHPDARGTNLYVLPNELPARNATGSPVIGSHVLGADFSGDVVGNAAALDVYKFLKLDVDGRSLLDALLIEDADAISALADDDTQARQLRDAFVALTQPHDNQSASHPLAKQLYWLADDDPTDDTAYHLLAPLYATSLAHAVHTLIQEDRFGETTKVARQARRDKVFHDGIIHDYPGLAVQKLGGTKPQNISQLNSERRGNNYLLSCAPPAWQERELPNISRASSLFNPHVYGALPKVGMTVSSLRRFLASNPPANMATRNRRDAYIDTLIDELVDLAARYQTGWTPGWSLHTDTVLHEDECLWLDPYRAKRPDEIEFRKKWLRLDWPDRIGNRFARWLNSRLEQQLPVGDMEHRHWKKELLLDETQTGWAEQLHKSCRALDTSAFMFSRKNAGYNA